MVPIRLSISAGGSLHFCPGLSSRVFSVASLGILMLDVCGGWWLDQFRSPKGTCKLKQKSWLHYGGVPLLFCPPEVHCANSHDLFQLTLHFPVSNTSTSLLKLNWPFRNVYKLPPLQQSSMVTLASSLQVCLKMGAYIFFLHFLTNTDNLGQKSINFVIVSKGRLLDLLVTLMFYLSSLSFFCSLSTFFRD